MYKNEFESYCKNVDVAQQHLKESLETFSSDIMGNDFIIDYC